MDDAGNADEVQLQVMSDDGLDNAMVSEPEDELTSSRLQDGPSQRAPKVIEPQKSPTLVLPTSRSWLP